jgi:outer membrane lipoprotein-sorting protein
LAALFLQTEPSTLPFYQRGKILAVFRSFRPVAIFAAVLSTAVAFGQPPPTASYLLSKINGAYSNLDQYKLVATIRYRDPDEQLDLSGTTTIAVRKPDKVRWELSEGIAPFFSGQDSDVLLVLDGISAWAYVPKKQEYTKEKEDVGAGPESTNHLEELFLDYPTFVNKADRARILRKEKLPFGDSSQDCYVLEIRDGPIDIYRLWVDSKRFLILREDKDSKEDSKGQYHTLSIVFSTIELRRPIDEQLFVFSPRADAKLVSEIRQ